MRTFIAAILLLATLSFAAIAAVPADDANVAGKWTMNVDADGQTFTLALELEQTGSEFKGKINSDIGGGTIENGKVTGNEVKGLIKGNFQGQDMEIDLEGKVEDEKMSGTMNGAGLPTLSFTATKAKE